MSQQSGEKTEKATPKRRKEAREKGQVLKSTELVTAFTMVVMFGALKALGPGTAKSMHSFLIRYLDGSSLPDGGILTQDNIHLVFTDSILTLLTTALPMLLVAMVAGVAINYAQVGFLFTSKTLKPDFSRINPLQGFKRMFSPNSLVELVKNVLKVTVVGVIVYQRIRDIITDFPNLMGQDVLSASRYIFETALDVAFRAGMALIVIGVADLFYQWRKHEKELRMTKQEVKMEYKMQEGDPLIKNKIRQKQRDMSAARMMHMVKQADVVITNPTHYAVALRYKDREDPAPLVLAKGRDLVAKRIREEARAHHVEIVENKPLARTLYASVEVGERIPEELFVAVAEVLAYVYKQKQGVRGNPPRETAGKELTGGRQRP